MTSRAIASIIFGAAVIVGTTGCSMIAPQATTIPYSAAEGINVSDANGPVKIRNLFIVADIRGNNGNLVGTFVNPTADDATVNIEVGDGADAVPVEVEVPANTAITLGGTDEADIEPILIKGLNTAPGKTVEAHITSGNETVSTMLSIYEDKLEYFKTLEPKRQ